jgi:Protein of unknown function (DUF2793)
LKEIMTNTPRLALPAIEAAQAQKHVTHNEALTLLDALTQLAVKAAHSQHRPERQPMALVIYRPQAQPAHGRAGVDRSRSLVAVAGFALFPCRA